MAEFDFTRLKRMTIIYKVVQVVFMLILAGVAFMFQTKDPGHFFFTFMTAIALQGVLLYPVYRLAWRDAKIEFDSSATAITNEQLLALRKKRLLGDLWKVALLVFFLIFIARIPDAQKTGTPFFLSTSLYSFLLIFLSYFQCFNYSSKKQIKSVAQ